MNPTTKSSQLTASRLRELLAYDPTSGLFTWVVQRGSARAGSVAGTPGAFNSVVIRVDRVLHQAHRLVWLYTYGHWPTHEVDHRDGVRNNNAFDNLREATRSENMQNREMRKLAGAFYCKDKNKNKWKSSIKLNRKVMHLGMFETQELAHAAYVAAKRRVHTFHPELRSDA